MTLIQEFIYRSPDAQIETIDGVMRWDDYLAARAREFKKHGRKAEIRKDKKTGKIGLFTNRVAAARKDLMMRDCTAINVRTMED